MRSQFDHEDLRVYQAAIGFVAWLEEITPGITSKVAACEHLARASAGVPVNIAEASGKRSMNERRQFIDTAYGSSLECAACLDVLCVLECLPASTVHDGKGHLSTIVSMLVGFRKSTGREVREEGVAYVTAGSKGNGVWFDHARTAALQAAATLDVLAVRQVKCTQDVIEGKSCLADIVRMLVAWERSLEER